MIDVRRLLPSDWSLYRRLRLAALADAPDAFGGTLAEAIAHPDAHWRERLARADPDTSHPLVAALDDVPCALAWAVTDLARPRAVALFQMWVAPEARGHGVGHRLVDACVDWATGRGHVTLHLECTLGNEPARRPSDRPDESEGAACPTHAPRLPDRALGGGTIDPVPSPSRPTTGSPR